MAIIQYYVFISISDSATCSQQKFLMNSILTNTRVSSLGTSHIAHRPAWCDCFHQGRPAHVDMPGGAVFRTTQRRPCHHLQPMVMFHPNPPDPIHRTLCFFSGEQRQSWGILRVFHVFPTVSGKTKQHRPTC